MERQPVKQSNQQNNIAFVLGNGTSRLKLNHKNLLDKGIVYACNAIYREFEPHHLIAVDVKMINEIVASGYHKTHSVWTNPNKGISNKHNLNMFNPHKGWSSGPTALWFASEQGHRDIYIFGFDYQGLQGKFNNVYADTYNYKKSNDAATFHGNWLSQTERTIRDFRNIQYHRVINSGDFIPDQLGIQLKNLKHITYEEFYKKFPDCTYTVENVQKTTI
jgi:hypothetical protein